MFASEEYNEYANTSYNDVSAIFFDGEAPTDNIALTTVGGGGPPGPGAPVCVNNVNGGNPFGAVNARNPLHFQNNDCGDGGLPGRPCAAPNRATEMDGLTKWDQRKRVFQTSVTLTAGSHYFELAVADTSDRVYDSNFFVKADIQDWGSCCFPDVGNGAYCAVVPIESVCTDALDAFNAGQNCASISCGTTGDCCTDTGPCVVTQQISCEQSGGVYGADSGTCGAQGSCDSGTPHCYETTSACCGAGTFVVSGTCEAFGACCTAGGGIIGNMTQSQCSNVSGEFHGGGTDAAVSCGVIKEVPSLTNEGLLMLALLMVVASGIIIYRMRGGQRATPA